MILSIRMLAAIAVVLVPPIIFEKYTYFLYATANPNFFTYSGDRLWFDIIWFCIAGAISTVIVGRNTKAAIIPPLVASLLFTVGVYVEPFCTIRECYVSSTDGLAPLRDFLLFGSLGVLTSAACMRSWFRAGQGKSRSSIRIDVAFQLGVFTLMGYALSFFPIMHIFAGVSVPFPENYFQWFLAGAPAGLAGSMWMLDRGSLQGITSKLFASASGVALALALAVEIPCEDCSGYAIPVSSIFVLAVAFCIPAILLEVKRQRTEFTRKTKLARRAPGIITTATIVITIILLWSFFLTANYQMSVVNRFSGVSNSSLSPLEVGRTFVYSAGYLAIPRVVSQSVGVNVSFGNDTAISQSADPNNFLAAGVGDQSPNCCKDGLDLSYRADVIEFSNGTEAVLARAWWACDVNMACGGYSWQQLLFLEAKQLPRGALSNWVELQMNWTSPRLIQWFYRIHYTSNRSETPWTLYGSFTPPKIQNHYWDAGLFWVGSGNHPTGYAYFYQFGVSSAYPIRNPNWQVYVQCPNIILNGSRECIPAAGYVNGDQSFWKVLYTFGETYPGMNFSYLGKYEVEFHYTGNSPKDGAIIWK